MSNHHKENCAKSWAHGEARKSVNRAANEARAEANKALRAAGKLTPHEEQRAKRRAARDALRAAGLLPPLGTTRAIWKLNKKIGTS